MFKSLHRASRNVVVGQDANGKDIEEKRFYTKEVSFPESVDDIIEIIEGSIKLDWDHQQMVEISVGYKQVGDKWERVYKTLPYPVAMCLEGMKLDLNQIITPKATDVGVTDEDVAAYEAAGNPNSTLIWEVGNAKVRKALKEKVLAFLASKK